MKTVTVKDKTFKTYLRHKQIINAVDKVSEQINKDLKGKVPLFLVVLNGAFVFATDLLQRIKLDCEISFVKLSSYQGTKSTETVRELIGLDRALKDRIVVIVEDIIDTGITMAYTRQKLKEMEAADVKIATLLFKPDAFKKDYQIDYIGLEIPNEFIIGYGLDYDGFGRNYPDIYQVVE